jgi:hypothetical protein
MQFALAIWQRGSVMGALSHLRNVEIGSAAATSYRDALDTRTGNIHAYS